MSGSRFERLALSDNQTLEPLLAAGRPPSFDALIDFEWHGYNTDSNLRFLGLRKFSKAFFRAEHRDQGCNIKVTQNVLTDPWLPRLRGGAIDAYAFFLVRLPDTRTHLAGNPGAVALARRPEPNGGDDLALARIRRERDQAALRFAKDRDLGRLEATMARLDAEARAAVVGPSRVPTAAEARAYLESLPDLWAKTSDAGRHAIAEAVFERIDVLGVTDYTVTLTAHAKARGWDTAFVAGVVRLKEGQSGRGERRQATLRHLNVPANLPLDIEVTGTEQWLRSSTA